jgi:putative nucleotidyltransferase with HDIG domain
MTISQFSIADIKLGVLAEEMPELYEMQGLIENNAWHDHDPVFVHSVAVLERMRKNLALDFVTDPQVKTRIESHLDATVSDYSKLELLQVAALLHDIGKPMTLKKEGELTTCINHEAVGADFVPTILKRLSFQPAEIEYIALLIKHHGLAHEVLDSSKTEEQLKEDFHRIKEQHRDIFVEMMLLALSDTEGTQLQEKDSTEFAFRVGFYHRLLGK